MVLYVLHEVLLADLQLQHDGAQLHVQVVGSLQLPLVVLPDVQCMPVTTHTLICYSGSLTTHTLISLSGSFTTHTLISYSGSFTTHTPFS